MVMKMTMRSTKKKASPPKIAAPARVEHTSTGEEDEEKKIFPIRRQKQRNNGRNIKNKRRVRTLRHEAKTNPLHFYMVGCWQRKRHTKAVHWSQMRKAVINKNHGTRRELNSKEREAKGNERKRTRKQKNHTHRERKKARKRDRNIIIRLFSFVAMMCTCILSNVHGVDQKESVALCTANMCLCCILFIMSFRHYIAKAVYQSCIMAEYG